MPQGNPSPKKASGKGKILGMPYWAAGLALVLGAVVGYFLLKSQPASGEQGADQSAPISPTDQTAGLGGGLGLSDLAASLGVPVHGGVSTGATNSTGAPSGGDSFSSPSSAFYPVLTASDKQQVISQSAGSLANISARTNQPVLTGQQVQQIAATTPATTAPAATKTYTSYQVRSVL